MVEGIFSEGFSSNAIGQMSEKSVGSSSGPIEDNQSKTTQSSKRVLDPNKVYAAEATGAGTLTAVEMTTPAEDSAPFQESSLGFGSMISSSLVGIFILKCVEGKKRIKDLRATLISLQEEFEALPQGSIEEKEALATRINSLEQLIITECKNKQKMIDLVVTKSCQGSVSSIRQVSILINTIQPGSHAATSVGASAGIALAICPLIALFFGSKNLRKVAKTGAKLRKEIDRIEALLLETDTSKKTLRLSALELRHRNLKKQEEDLTIRASKEMFLITSGALGTVSSVEVLTSSVGLGAGLFFGTALTATGIGAIVTGAIALLIGTGYAVHKNKENLHFLAADTKASLQEMAIRNYIAFLKQREKFVKNKFKKLEEQVKKSWSETAEEFYRSKIDEVWGKIQELKADLCSEKELARLEREHQSLVLACIGQKLGKRKVSPNETDWTHLLAVNKEQRKVEQVTQRLEGVRRRRSTLSDVHTYEKFLNKFSTSSDAEPITMSDLKKFERDYISAACNDRLELVHLFFGQLTPASKDDDSLRIDWLEKMGAITASVE